MNNKEDIKFSSIEDLYNRVKPALKVKLKELRREKYDYIKIEDIWNYLIKSKWVKAKGLVLCDVVDDILHSENDKIDLFVKQTKKNMKEEIIKDNIEFL